MKLGQVKSRVRTGVKVFMDRGSQGVSKTMRRYDLRRTDRRPDSKDDSINIKRVDKRSKVFKTKTLRE